MTSKTLKTSLWTLDSFMYGSIQPDSGTWVVLLRCPIVTAKIDGRATEVSTTIKALAVTHF
jgi:hypothetical protein